VSRAAALAVARANQAVVVAELQRHAGPGAKV